MAISHPKFVAICDALVEWANGQETAVARADAAMTTQAQLQELVEQLANVKSVAVRELWAQGWTLVEIGEALGISKSRVEQIIKR